MDAHSLTTSASCRLAINISESLLGPAFFGAGTSEACLSFIPPESCRRAEGAAAAAGFALFGFGASMAYVALVPARPVSGGLVVVRAASFRSRGVLSFLFPAAQGARAPADVDRVAPLPGGVIIGAGRG